MNYLAKSNSISYYDEKKYLINHKLKIGFYLKCLRSSGSLKSRVKRNDNNQKRRHKTVWNLPYSVTTSKSVFREISSFFRNFKGFKLIILGGTEQHEQLLFIRKHLKPNCKSHMYHEAKVFDSNLKEEKLTLPIASLIRQMNIMENNPQNIENLLYDRASHRLTNTTNNCAVYVAIEISNSMLDARDPFSRSKLPFYKPNK